MFITADLKNCNTLITKLCAGRNTSKTSCVSVYTHRHTHTQTHTHTHTNCAEDHRGEMESTQSHDVA